MNAYFAKESSPPPTGPGTALTKSVLQEPKILLLTPYTGSNLGDGAIQDAVIYHLRRRFAKAQIQLVTLCPQATSNLHGVPSFPIASSSGRDSASSSVPTAKRKRLRTNGRLIGQIKRVPWLYQFISKASRPVRNAIDLGRSASREISHLLRVLQILRKTDLLVMSGGGQLDDYWGGAFGQPYALFKWASLAKFTRTPTIFLSVGVCVLDSRMSRFFVIRALQLASYRSFRDHGSKELLSNVAFTRNDPEYPDLAFGHPRGKESMGGAVIREKPHYTIGVSPIIFHSPHGWPEREPGVYGLYIQTLCEFVAKILDAGHSVVLFSSAVQDRFAVKDLQAQLVQAQSSDSWGSRLQESSPSRANDLLDAINRMDVVVASRLHGILLSHLMGKPVLAISYDRKVRAHMEDMSQESNCLDLRSATLHELWERLSSLVRDPAAVSGVIGSKADERYGKVNSQFDRVLALFPGFQA